LEGALPLTIVNGSARSAWGAPAEGSVSPQGVLVMRTPTGCRFDGQIDGKGIVTGRWNCTCSYQVVWQKLQLSGSTTAFDGEYIGVSMELSKTPSAPGAGCPPISVPLPLTITNGVALTPGGEGWAGSVSAQGVLVMRLYASRFDGQIDSQGIIRGQKIRGTNCVYTSIWQKKSQ
jgi:hypothetical protein